LVEVAFFVRLGRTSFFVDPVVEFLFFELEHLDLLEKACFVGGVYNGVAVWSSSG
jgi:hypothetical protein